MVTAGFALVAFRFGCLRHWALTVAAALALALLTFAPSGLYDVENYLAPQTLLHAGVPLSGDYSPLHCALPDLLARFGAALYRLTGSTDLATAALWLWLAAAWHTLRATCSRLQTALLLFSPLTLLGVGNLMPDGALYCLLLIALCCVADTRAPLTPARAHLALAALALAAMTKMTAWIPGALLGGVLLYRAPRLWWKAALAAAGVALFCLPTLRLLAAGQLREISSDFLSANADAQAMGYCARVLYVYLGHWTTSLAPNFGVAVLSADGASADALGPGLRLTLWGGALLALCCRRHLRGWGGAWALCLFSLLCVPRLYVGYARYVPLLYPAAMLPWVMLRPRWAVMPCALLAAVPVAFIGWRLFLATEAITVATHATAVQSPTAASRALFAERLVAPEQPTRSGNLLYTYTLARPEAFPSLARTPAPDLRLQGFHTKGRDVARALLRRWLPWALRSTPRLLGELLSLRLRAFCRLHFQEFTDGVSPAHP
ncbi:MAG: hypothetical protein ACI4RT_07755 [Candidatus Spyradenecus sp.]